MTSRWRDIPAHSRGFYSRGKQQIHEQIQKRLEDKSMQEEVQKLERQQEVEKQEKAKLEDLKVPPQRWRDVQVPDPPHPPH